jgi:hypothetical protein
LILERSIVTEMNIDVNAAERAERDLDAFINRRSRVKEKANAEEAAWAESTRRYNARRRERNRQEWRAYHLNQADCLERTAAELAARHRAKAERLIEQEAEVMEARGLTS